ncbi:MAG: tetratricopeptide repeat protein [Archangium sp.]|nr:tetratricopeptide repeat protein [Archangium sp.]
MLATLLSLALTAGPTAAQAAAFAKGKQWEELYLAFAAASPDASAKADRPKIAQALLAGCLALQVDDAVMAFSLGEKSVAFAPTADGLYCTGVTAKRSDQRGAAEEALKKGAGTFPKDARFNLELGRLYLEDGQPGEAASTLARVPVKAKESGEARRLIAQIARESGESVGGPKVRVENVPGDPSTPPGMSGEEGRATSRSYESSVDADGRRVRQNQYFRFYYFNSKRDFGQRAEYEGRVQGALEDARLAAQRLLGVAREKPVDVILYSREEFRLHHGPQAAQAVAGFYSEDAIRMNDSAEINDRNRSTLVHEYVHAVMDELGNFNQRSLPVWMHEGLAEYIEWRAEGVDGPPKHYATALQQLALQDQLPRLAQMSNGPLIANRNPGLAYAVAAVAVRLLVERRGMREVIELIQDCGKGTPFEQALERRFGTSISRLDEELTSSLK